MTDTTAPALELISFCIGEQEFCIDVKTVREIRGWTPATPIPHAPSYMRGVINLRGAIMPVIDLRNRLGLGVTIPETRHVIVVVECQDRLAGILVDAVSETFTVPRDQPAAGPRRRRGRAALHPGDHLDGKPPDHLSAHERRVPGRGPRSGLSSDLPGKQKPPSVDRERRLFAVWDTDIALRQAQGEIR
jgi:purine-binding chemotaxis protein CheW